MMNYTDEEYLGDPQQGTFEQGVGVPDVALQNPNVSLADGVVSRGHPMLQSPGILIGLAIVAIVLGYIDRGHTDEFKRVRIGFDNLFRVGVLAAIFIYITKTGSALITARSGFMYAVKQFFGAL